jgi:2-phosphosulfolactate phosphatase
MSPGVRLALQPSDLEGLDIRDSSVVVFDVLRATTTIVTALAAGATEVRAFVEVEQARAAAATFVGPRLLAGERGCLPPSGFDLGNSPVDYTPARVAGHCVFLSTTNGTRAIRACADARHTLVASLCNATATAKRLAELGTDVVLLCAGVDGAPGGEDIDGAMTVLDIFRTLRPDVSLSPDIEARCRQHSWTSLAPQQRLARLLDSPGGANLLKVGLRVDIEFCAVMDRHDLVATVSHARDFASIRSE